MKAWLLDSLAGIDTLRLADHPDPSPGPGEVVLGLRFAALNPADRYLAEGAYPARPAFPHILGRDGVGVVSAVGPGVTGVGIGDTRLILRSEIGVSRPGTLAQRVTAPVESLVEAPAGWSPQQSAAAPLVYLTAWQAITQWADLTPLPDASRQPADCGQGRVVLITGASGGVGVAATQLASAMGHRVIGMSRSAEKTTALLEQGAQLVLDPTDTQWRRRIKAHLGDARVDLAIDNIGGPLLSEVIDTLGMDGRISLVGRLAGPVPQFNTASMFFRRLQMRGVAVGTYTPAQSREAWASVVEMLSASSKKPLVDSVFPFAQVAAAFDRLAAGPMGKVLLEIDPSAA